MRTTYPLYGSPESSAGAAGAIRRATVQDLLGIVSVHRRAFSQFFLTRLGSEFLRRYYRLVLDYRAGIVFVGETGGKIKGFVCGFKDPVAFYRLMWNKRRAFLLPVVSALIRRPSLAAGVLHGVQRIQSSASACDPALAEGACELSSIAVAPEASSGGLGAALLEAFLEQAWRLEAKCVYLTTDADSNAAANALYRKAGFEHAKRFLQRKGRWMNWYVIGRKPAEDAYGRLR
ncbi:MAG TPA: GNAT family N-acetyltransferase [Bryobacteraceae bacterium]|nr:GNAT family N-acetyltransferase [Bryobacteraceae bacterium]